MVAGYHLIWMLYGWWLPNDPRGSSSHVIRSDIIAALGELHHGRKKIQPASRELAKFYDEAEKILRYELRTFSSEEIAIVAKSFHETMQVEKYTCYAGVIMPDHVHLLIRCHRDHAEDMIQKLQTASRYAILDAGFRESSHPVWGGPGWKVYLDTVEDFERTIEYVGRNPEMEGLPEQYWDFIKPTMVGCPSRRGKIPENKFTFRDRPSRET